MKTAYILLFTFLSISSFAQAGEIVKDTSIVELEKFLQKNIRYPAVARENNIQGLIVVSINLDDYGNIVEAHLQRGLYQDCDDEVLNQLRKYKHQLPLKNGRYSFGVFYKFISGNYYGTLTPPTDKDQGKNYLFQMVIIGYAAVRKTYIVN